jgi:hypothetical protein
VGASTIIINTFFAHFWLGEALTPRDIAATLFVLVGIIIVSVFMNKGGKSYDLKDLLELHVRLLHVPFFFFRFFVLCPALCPLS